VLGFNLVVFGCYRVKETTKEEFVANAIQVEMQHHHFYIVCHAAKAANATATYRTKHRIVDTNMV
jgi:hypothetical protein